MVIVFSFYSERGKILEYWLCRAFINSRIYIFDSAMFNTGENGSLIDIYSVHSGCQV